MIMIYFTNKPRPKDYNDRIRKRFNIDNETSINGMSKCNTSNYSDKDWSDLKKTQELGFIQIRKSNDNKRFTHRPEN